MSVQNMRLSIRSGRNCDSPHQMGWVNPDAAACCCQELQQEKHREACRRVGLLEIVHVAGPRSVFYPLGLMMLPQPATLYVLSAAGHLVGILSVVKGGGLTQVEQHHVILKGLPLIEQVFSSLEIMTCVPKCKRRFKKYPYLFFVILFIPSSDEA